MNNFPRQKLQELITQYGRVICDDHIKMNAILRDLCPEHKREINVLVGALREKVATDLMKASDTTPKEILLPRLTQRLYDNLGVAKEFAQWAVESWALALGVTKKVIARQTQATVMKKQKARKTVPPPQQVLENRNWWNQLDQKWRMIFINAIDVIDGEPNDNELVKIVNLRKLCCRRNRISSLAPLSHLSNLQELDCVENKISNLDQLCHFTHLQKLYCWRNEISHLGPLSHFTRLREFSCGNNQISSLEPLRYLIHLQVLYCGGNQINSLESLRELKKIEKLHINGNQIRSLEPLYEMKNLRHLDCRNTQVSKSEIRNFKKAVPECYYVNHSYQTLLFW